MNQENKNVYQIQRPEGIYTIIYGPHNRPQDPGQFPETFNGFVMEGGTVSYSGKLPNYFALEDWLRVLAPQSVSMVEFAQERRLPIYHADFSMKGIFGWPETLFLLGQLSTPVRETLIAHKEEWLMRQLGNFPHLVTIMGSAHVGLIEEIQKPSKERLEFLRRRKFPIKLTSSSNGEAYKISRCDYNGNSWKVGEIFEVPDLKALFS